MVKQINYPYTFEGGEKAVASEVNSDFEEVKMYANSVSTEIAEIKKLIGQLEERPTREMFDVYPSFRGETPTGAYPLWTGETITHCDVFYPEFWKEVKRLADASLIPTVKSNEEYDQKVQQYGQCPCFFVDKLNGNVRLPKITRFISSISSISDLGKVFNDQIKKHAHVSKIGPSSITASNKNAIRYDVAQFNSSGKTSETGENEGFPKHVRLALYLQVVNNTAELSRLDVDALKKELETYLTRMEDEYNKYIQQMQQEFNKIKGDIATAAKIYKYENVRVSPEEFVEDLTYPDYPVKVDIDIEDALVSSVPTVVFSVADALSGNYAPIADAGDGIVTIYAKARPEAELVIPTILVL